MFVNTALFKNTNTTKMSNKYTVASLSNVLTLVALAFILASINLESPDLLLISSSWIFSPHSDHFLNISYSKKLMSDDEIITFMLDYHSVLDVSLRDKFTRATKLELENSLKIESETHYYLSLNHAQINDWFHEYALGGVETVPQLMTGKESELHKNGIRYIIIINIMCEILGEAGVLRKRNNRGS